MALGVIARHGSHKGTFSLQVSLTLQLTDTLIYCEIIFQKN